MSREEMLIAGAGALALLLTVLLALAFVMLARTRREFADLRAALDDRTPAADVGVLESIGTTYVIATLPDDDATAGGHGPVTATVAEPIDGRLFADIVARESVVRAGGLIHGLRRALDPETRNRIRFEMRREIRRARRQRRSDLKTAMRDFQARGRAEEDAA